MDESTLARFMAKVQKQDHVTSPHVDTPCWLWTAAKNNKGYGQLSVGGRSGSRVYSHRLSLEHFVEPLRKGFYVCHRCDTPHCVRPEHLFQGTPTENVADCIRKGRAWRGRQPVGQDHHAAKVTREQVVEMRAYARAGESTSTIAARFGVSREHAWQVVSGRTWKHLPL